MALSGLLPRDTDETKGNQQSIGDLYAVSNSDVPDRKQVLGQYILYDLLTLKCKELCSCELSESDYSTMSLKKQGLTHLLKKGPAQCSWLVSPGVHWASS